MSKAARITEQDFYITKPQAMGLRGWSLLLPAVASSVGFFAFGVLAFSFTELEALGDFRRVLVIVGAITLAFGSEVGTLASVTEIYRKGEILGKWDKFALGVSILATFGAFTLAFAELLGARATWGETVQMYGPVVLGLLAALDSYGGFMEFGLYLGTFDKRMSEWVYSFEEFKRQTLAAEYAERQAERQAAREKLTAQAAENVSTTAKYDSEDVGDLSTLERARAVKAERDLTTKQGRIDKMLSIFRGDPEAAITDVAEAIGVTRQTVYSYLSELEAAGTIHNNGGGVKVLM